MTMTYALRRIAHKIFGIKKGDLKFGKLRHYGVAQAIEPVEKEGTGEWTLGGGVRPRRKKMKVLK
jgi:hypothetical protein